MARRPDTDEFHFEGFESPNTTPVPDVVFDRLLVRLGEAELKALLYIIRRTFGFKKDRDPISFNQFLRGITTRDGTVLDGGCGVKDRTTLSKALKSLESKGIVLSEKGTDERGENATTVYRLRFRSVNELGKSVPEASSKGVVGIAHHPSMNHLPPVVGNPYPQETALQQTEINISNIRNVNRNVDKFEETKPRSRTSATETDRRTQTNGVPGQVRSVGEVIAGSAVGRTIETRRPRVGARRDEETVTSDEVGSVRSGRGATTPSAPGRGRPRQVPQQDEVYQVIQAYIADFSRELNDRAPLRSSTTRAYNLYKRSGLDQDAFIAQLYAARAIVKERAATIRTSGADNATGFPVKHRAGYYFAVLEDLLGLREPASADSNGTGGSTSSTG
jgi:hypothetical protein